MNDEKKEILDSETQAEETQTQKTTDAINETDTISDISQDELKESDSTFSVEHVESEAALTQILDAQPDTVTEDSPTIMLTEEEKAEQGEAVEQELKLSKYAADCLNCATKVYFEKEDLDEENNLICPNCNEKIEINVESLDYYLVNKSSTEQITESASEYVVDCSSCEAVVHFKQDDIDDDENVICPQCGEKIHIDTEVLDAYKEVDIEKSLKKKRTLKKVLASLAGVVLALVVCCAVIYFVGNKSVVKVDGTSVPMNIYNAVYYIENAANYTSAGFNPDEKPSKQKYTESDDYKTWDDFLNAQTSDALKLYYGIYNEGQKAGYQMKDKDKESVDNAIKNIKSYAQSANQSFEDYMKSMYGLKISENDFRPYLELTAYVNSYFKSVMSKDITKKQLDKIYKDNPDNYQVVSFRYFYVQVSDSVKAEDALKTVEKISKAKTEKEFHKLVTENVNKDNAANYKDKDSTLVKDMACSNIQNRPVAKLLTNDKAKKGETVFGLSDDKTFAEVAMLVVPKHKDDDLVMDAAINEVSAEKGQKYIDGIRKNTTVKSSLGMILRNLTF